LSVLSRKDRVFIAQNENNCKNAVCAAQMAAKWWRQFYCIKDGTLPAFETLAMFHKTRRPISV
jgi:hypothetical protein